MRICCRILSGLALVALTAGWIDYGDNVAKKDPVFGKEFEGFSIKLHTKKTEFEQDEPEKVIIEIKNANPRATLLSRDPGEGRFYALHVVVADKNGTTQFTRDLLKPFKIAAVARGEIAPKAKSTLAEIPFSDLEVAAVDEYLHGVPYFDEKKRLNSTANLVPQIYTLKVILLSGLPDQKPDFVVASDIWYILLRPKSAERMTGDERTVKMQKWLKKMGEGAYGGVGVSSQLAALGEMSVDPLIEMAEKTEGGKVGESRIWAIVTLCGTRSKKAEDYILKRMFDPVSFGDLSFLVWHSQGFRSERIRTALLEFCEDAATGKPLPWEKKHGPKSRAHAKGSLEFAFKHLISIKRSCTDATAKGVLTMGDPKIASFGLMAWKPSSPEAACDILGPMFGERVHGNLKKAILNCLSQGNKEKGFTKYDRLKDVNTQWIDAALWLKRRNKISDDQFVDGLRMLVFDIRKEAEDVQRTVISRLQAAAGATFPVKSTRLVLPDDWVATWRWAIQTSGIEKTAAIQYICAKAKTRDAVPDAVKLGMILELKQLIGAKFPLKSTKDINLEEAWPTCGQWLVENGYFGKG